MKKTISSIIILMALLLSLVSCGNQTTDTGDSNDDNWSGNIYSGSTTIYENDDIELALTKIDKVIINDNEKHYELKLSITNKSDETYSYYVDQMVIEGLAIGFYSGNPVPAGSKLVEPFFIKKTELDDAGIDSISSIKILGTIDYENDIDIEEFETEVVEIK